MWGIDTTVYNDYYYGRFKKKAATQFVRDNFQCDYEYADKTRSGLIWTVKIYSKSGELLEVHKRVLIGYYSKIVRRPVLDRHQTSEFWQYIVQKQSVPHIFNLEEGDRDILYFVKMYWIQGVPPTNIFSLRDAANSTSLPFKKRASASRMRTQWAQMFATANPNASDSEP